MSNGITIQINSVAALERLLGDDAELAIELRRSVAAEFARRHLETLVTDAIRSEREQSEAKVKKLIEEELFRLKKTNAWPKEWELTPKVQDVLKQRVTELVADAVSAMGTSLNKKIEDESAKMAARIPAAVAEKYIKTFDSEVNKAVTARLAELRALLPVGEETRKITVP